MTARLRAALLLPDGPVDGPLPVLLDPYGGPHAPAVHAAHGAFLTSQWLADQGFAVVVCDGRGTPGRGPAWERAVRGDFADPVLDDQVDALHALAAHDDRARPRARSASAAGRFGGYLAALAVLRRPGRLPRRRRRRAGHRVAPLRHALHRALPRPPRRRARGLRPQLLTSRDGAGALSGPLLIIHGLADDNVVVAHTLRLSSALLEPAARTRCCRSPASPT